MMRGASDPSRRRPLRRAADAGGARIAVLFLFVLFTCSSVWILRRIGVPDGLALSGSLTVGIAVFYTLYETSGRLQRRHLETVVPGQMRRTAEEIDALDRSGAPDGTLDEAFLRMRRLSCQTTTDYYLAILKEAIFRAPSRSRARYLKWMDEFTHREGVRLLLREIGDGSAAPLPPRPDERRSDTESGESRHEAQRAVALIDRLR